MHRRRGRSRNRSSDLFQCQGGDRRLGGHLPFHRASPTTAHNTRRARWLMRREPWRSSSSANGPCARRTSTCCAATRRLEICPGILEPIRVETATHRVLLPMSAAPWSRPTATDVRLLAADQASPTGACPRGPKSDVHVTTRQVPRRVPVLTSHSGILKRPLGALYWSDGLGVGVPSADPCHCLAPSRHSL